MKSIEAMKAIAQKAMQEINWDNYKLYNEETDREDGYFRLGEVFFTQLEWIKENIPLNDDTEELHDYIETIQDACEVFNILDDLTDKDNEQ